MLNEVSSRPCLGRAYDMRSSYWQGPLLAINSHSVGTSMYFAERNRNIIGSPHCCIQASRSTDYLVKTCNIIVNTIVLQSQQITIHIFYLLIKLKGKRDENEVMIWKNNEELCWFTLRPWLKIITLIITRTQINKSLSKEKLLLNYSLW
jgi:hypothetical protein